WPECNAFPAVLAIHAMDNGAQTDNVICDHEEENNHRNFWRDVNQEYNERINANKKLQRSMQGRGSEDGRKKAGIYEIRFYSLVGALFSKLGPN
ncbi:39761_t:CDS:2, partial [Gigaspora margarita]